MRSKIFLKRTTLLGGGGKDFYTVLIILIDILFRPREGANKSQISDLYCRLVSTLNVMISPIFSLAGSYTLDYMLCPDVYLSVYFGSIN